MFLPKPYEMSTQHNKQLLCFSSIMAMSCIYSPVRYAVLYDVNFPTSFQVSNWVVDFRLESILDAAEGSREVMSEQVCLYISSAMFWKLFVFEDFKYSCMNPVSP